MLPTLYVAVGACSLAQHIALEWIGKPYDAARVALGSKELLAINPAGAVSTPGEDDGWVLKQAGAIFEYLVSKHPEAGLAGSDSRRAKAEAQSEAARRAEVDAEHKPAAKQFDILNRHLERREYILDGRRSVIDAYSFSMIRWAKKLLPGGLQEFRNVRALHDRLAADTSVQSVLTRVTAG